MSSRNDILNRLRERANPGKKSKPSFLQDNNIYADYPQKPADLLELFKLRFDSLSGELIVVKDLPQAATSLLGVLQGISSSQCKTHRSPLINALRDQEETLKDFLNIIDEEDINSVDFAGNEVGITEADYLIARTGSILIRTVSAGGRRLSVLPPTHIVIAHENQLIPSLDEAFKLLKGDEDFWSYATIISGPSRTSDIEKQLVLGAHGPKRLIVILIKEKE
jgi:L-lactate dehydrogenase complex protein LldG